jgi:hypothetical protein
MGISRTFARKAALVVLGATGSVAQSSYAKPATTKSILAATDDNSIYSPFGMVNGVATRVPWTMDANGHYTNPDAITANKALTLYVAGALRYPVHPAQSNPACWEIDERYTGVDNPGKLTTPFKVDAFGDIVTGYGNVPDISLVGMFRKGNDRTKAIIIAVVVAARDQVANAASQTAVDAEEDGAYRRGDGFFPFQLAAARDDTELGSLAKIAKKIALSPTCWDKERKETVLEGIWATTNGVLEDSRPFGGVMARLKKVMCGPQSPDVIPARTLISSLVGIPYPPQMQVAGVPKP